MENNLPAALAAFDESAVMGEIRRRLEAENTAPLELVRELQQGMALVGEKFEGGDYFLSELLMSADLFTRAMEILEPRIEASAIETIGRLVIGTPKGDIHDIGKNIFCTVARGAGFEVHDLGVDVPAERFVSEIDRLKPDILGFSALLTTAFQGMKDVIDSLEEAGLRQGLKVIVGGGVVTENVQRFIGADGHTRDAMDGLNQCRRWV